MNQLQSLVMNTIDRYGDEAATHFGIANSTLRGYVKTGKFPLKFIEKVLVEAAVPPPEPVIPVADKEPTAATSADAISVTETYPEKLSEVPTPPIRIDRIEQYIQKTVDASLLDLYRKVNALEINFAHHVGQPAPRQVQRPVDVGRLNLVRPDSAAEEGPVFTTLPGHPFDTGIAPSRDQVDAQRDIVTVEGVRQPGGKPSGPATPMGGPGFGFGWNTPRPSRK